MDVKLGKVVKNNSLKVAVLISGYLRTFQNNIENIKKNLIHPFYEVDVYIHITKNEEINDKYFNPHNFSQLLRIIESELKPKSILIEDNKLFSTNKKENDLKNLWAKFFTLNNLKCQEEEKNKKKYDLVIKTRPDISFKEIKINEKTKDIVLPSSSKIDKSKLKSLNDSYVCDIFAYGPSSLMDQYFEINNQIDDLIPNFGLVSETLLSNYLIENNISFKKDENIIYEVILSTCNVFAICGDSGSGKSTLGELLKQYFSNSFLLECDRYHKWERGDSNWFQYTHLNPEANFLSKMSEDIFNLKIGNSIYQVDYDHSTGKFTEKEKIKSTDNIIVCGLHSLYNSQSVYNLKIFMDTSDDLRIDWKFNRDIKSRGHSKESVLNQINNRKNDYLKYILPQKELADIIVHFYKLNEEQGLMLSFDKKFSLQIKKILNHFNHINIPYVISESEKFVSVIFEKYVDHISHKFTLEKEKLWYNYVLYMILNLYNDIENG